MRAPTPGEARAVLTAAIGLLAAASRCADVATSSSDPNGFLRSLFTLDVSDGFLIACALFAILGATRRSLVDSTYDAIGRTCAISTLMTLGGSTTRAGRTRARALSASASVAYADAWSPATPKKAFISAFGWVLLSRVLNGAFVPEAIAVACARACAWGLHGASAEGDTTALSIGFAVVAEWCAQIWLDSRVGGTAKYSEASALGGAYALAGCAFLLASARLVCWAEPASRATQLGVVAAALVVPEMFYRVTSSSRLGMVPGLIRYVFATTKPDALASLATLWCTGVATALGLAYNARSLPLTMRRKAFHFLAVVMFAPTLVPDSEHGELIRVAFTVAFALFAALECARVFDAYYGHGLFGWKLSIFFAQFVGDTVVSLLILDHFSLLLGVAVPIWLSDDQNSLVPWAGVLTLGVGDSFASIVGSAVGRHRVFGEKSFKTLEGAIAFAVSTYVAALYVGVDVDPTRLAFACVGTALCELSIEGADNLVLPLVFTALLSA
ncbi:Phosphatidate cytidylyltransferase [Ostreococcus tauri]|uniref:dolichol kinase n=1 Tax=Ostreococcus tauri TaxID=70448 RepID=A0A090M3X1_OSTTA|nr:Phosphatidate cytidylyltransferase [Ostreococcus tauri]CEF98876.1 Phosphatidate cytidylyltransferase [Ostreococcus tauri]|eukprot:XP_003080545.2 Phosphatidate cytidylyltransferase [Ostreococcus tauri]